MPEQTDPLDEPQPAGPNPFAGLRRAFYALALLMALWLVFGQIIPRFFMHKQPQLQTAEAPISEKQQSLQELLKEKDDRIATLGARLDQLEARLNALETTPPASPNAMTSEMEARLKSQEEQLQAVVVMAAFGPLKDAALRGEPFAGALARVSKLTQDNAAIAPLLARLAPYAEKGAPTLETLQKTFEATPPKTLPPGNTLARNLQSLIRIRKTGEPQGADDESVLARAETKLSRGDVTGALAELAALSSPAAEAFSVWSTDAQEFLQVLQSVDELQAALA